jgi:hypothetical protein
MFSLDNGAKEISIGNNIQVEPEFEAPEFVRSHR